VQSKIGHARHRVSRIAVFDAVLAGQAYNGDPEPLSPYGFAIKTTQFAKYGGKSGLGLVILEPATATILGLLHSRIQINSENTHRKSKLSA
jgi:hypothetical protein